MTSSPAPTGTLYGRVLDDGDTVQILALDQVGGVALGQWIRPATESAPQLAAPDGAAPLLLVVSALPEQAAQAFALRAGAWHPVACAVIRLRADYGVRLAGLFESTALAATCVTVIGLGSGGSVAAAQLVRCGVGRLRLVDFDRLETDNIMRHACGLRDIGRYKTRAVRDLLLDTAPSVEVETFEANILDEPAVLQRVLVGCDLVVVATDSEPSKAAINAACWPLGVPAVYGAAYNRAFGGDVFCALPPAGACYACFQRVLTEFFAPPPTAATDFSLGYADPERMADLVAEPGIAMDIGLIAHLLARVALQTLLQKHATSLPDLPTNWLLFGNRAEWIFEKPLESVFIEVEKQPDCPICNYEAYVRRQLDMSPAEAAAEAERLLNAITDELDSELPQAQQP